MGNPAPEKTCVPDPDHEKNTGDDGGGTCNGADLDVVPVAVDEEVPPSASSTRSSK